MHIKDLLLLIKKVAYVLVAVSFLSHSFHSSLPYIQHHITVNKNGLSASLNKTFSFLLFFFKYVACIKDSNKSLKIIQNCNV